MDLVVIGFLQRKETTECDQSHRVEKGLAVTGFLRRKETTKRDPGRPVTRDLAVTGFLRRKGTTEPDQRLPAATGLTATSFLRRKEAAEHDQHLQVERCPETEHDRDLQVETGRAVIRTVGSDIKHPQDEEKHTQGLILNPWIEPTRASASNRRSLCGMEAHRSA